MPISARLYALPVWCSLAAIMALGGCSGGSFGSAGTYTPPVPDALAPQAVAQAPVHAATESESVAQAEPLVTSTPPPVAYVTAYYTSGSGENLEYQGLVYSFDTLTNKFVSSPLVKVPGLPEGSALSRDGKELYDSRCIGEQTQSKRHTVWLFRIALVRNEERIANLSIRKLRPRLCRDHYGIERRGRRIQGYIDGWGL
jgi:hypothetical protein